MQPIFVVKYLAFAIYSINVPETCRLNERLSQNKERMSTIYRGHCLSVMTGFRQVPWDVDKSYVHVLLVPAGFLFYE